MTRTNFHVKSYGWNYFVETSNDGRIRIGRYFTNGSQNSLTERTKWGVAQSAPLSWGECEQIMLRNR